MTFDEPPLGAEGVPRRGRAEGAQESPHIRRVDGRVVPVYALTGGRTRSRRGPDMPIETLVTVAPSRRGAAGLDAEYRIAVDLAANPISIIEIGAALGVPVGVARVLVCDLVDTRHLRVHLPPSSGPAPEILERLLEGLRAR